MSSPADAGSAADPRKEPRVEPKDTAATRLRELGAFIREQRGSAQMSLRSLADKAGVSNPYLSQIERGLRKPSAEILQRVAEALRISAETLYVKAGILEEHSDDLAVRIDNDPDLTERQKRVLLEVYESFRAGEPGVGAGPARDGSAGDTRTEEAAGGEPAGGRTDRAGRGTGRRARSESGPS